MHDEALITLPRVLEATGVRDHILVGHSDGASIALIYSGEAQKGKLLGLVLEAPHVFVEELSLASITRSAEDYREGRLRAALERHHGQNTDCAFWGWNRAWLDPGFRAWNIEECLPAIAVPVLVVQGVDDPYGTLAQVEAIERGARGPATRLILDRCGHSPHRDQPDATLAAMAGFIRRHS